MSKNLIVFLGIAWAMWFGGLVALFVFVVHLFSVSHELGVTAAPRLFEAFDVYQDWLALLCMAGSLGLIACGEGRRGWILAALLGTATAMALLGPWLLTDRMMALWRAGQSGSEQFKRLHGLSMLLNTAQALVLLGAGIALLWGRFRPGNRVEYSETT